VFIEQVDCWLRQKKASRCSFAKKSANQLTRTTIAKETAANHALQILLGDVDAELGLLAELNEYQPSGGVPNLSLVKNTALLRTITSNPDP
jgi:hypothetical protein